MPKLISFADAILDSAQYSKRHLILGNGFSISCLPDIFNYSSLYKQADFSDASEAKKLFKKLKSQDFEVVIHALETSATVLSVYAPRRVKARDKMLGHAERLKEILVSTIASNHPTNPNTVNDQRFYTCRRFLNHFLGQDTNGYIFTLNYDLLLYWALMHDDPLTGGKIVLRSNDGFGNDNDDPDADYVVWRADEPHATNVFFLHGALHLFDSGSELKKYTWVRKGIPLVKQVSNAIVKDKFPLFVAEGTSRQKKSKIRHSAYLYQCYKVLSANVQQSRHCFFIFGHSLAESDDHILQKLGQGCFEKLYVSIYGDLRSDVNKKIAKRVKKIASLRRKGKALKIVYFDSNSANVWGEN